MKNAFFLFTFIVFTAFTAAAQNQCNAFFPFQEGAVLEYQHYDKKDKPEGVSYMEIENLESTSEGGVEARVKSRFTDKKGKEAYEGSYTVKCAGNTLYMDMSKMMPSQMLESMGDMEATMESEGLIIPSSLEVGQTLPDAEMTINVGGGGLGNLMNMNFSITNRKVEGRETVATPAGEFDCHKITYDTHMKMMMNKTFQSAEWYAEGVGVVKSATYDKKGNLDTYMVLNKFEK